MADMTDLETRIRALEQECTKLKDIEAIRQLKYRYWRSITKALWDEVVDCFTEDCAVNFGFGIRLQGRKALLKFYTEQQGPMWAMNLPRGHNPEIEITSGTTARALWQLDQVVIESPTNAGLGSGTSYEDEYVKENGEWNIKSTKTTLLYRYPLQIERLGKRREGAAGKAADTKG